MTRYAVVISFNTEDVGNAIDFRNEIEDNLCKLVTGWPINHVTLHKDTRPDSKTLYPPFEVVPSDRAE